MSTSFHDVQVDGELRDEGSGAEFVEATGSDRRGWGRWVSPARRLGLGFSVRRPGNDLGRQTHSHAAPTGVESPHLTRVDRSRPVPSSITGPCIEPRLRQGPIGARCLVPNSSEHRHEGPRTFIPPGSSHVGEDHGRKRRIFHNWCIFATTSCGGKSKTTIFRSSFPRKGGERELRS